MDEELTGKILIYGGTAEGRTLACSLARQGLQVCVSVASQAGADALPVGLEGLEVHVGSMSHLEKVEFMRGFDHVVDATHPYATSISGHVRSAAQEAGRPFLRVIRPGSDLSGCTVVPTVADAVAALPAWGNVLATTGAKQIAEYASLPGFASRLYARVLDDPSSVELCRKAGLPESHVLAQRGPFSLEQNIQTLKEHDISHLVTKDGGAAGGFPEKLQAARECGVAVVVVERPCEEEGISAQEAFERICNVEEKR